MKNVTGIICELDPLHKGHEYIISRAREESDVTLLVMSGSFCQRGTPAVYDKYARAEAAVRCGADIVATLPYPWCTDGVEGFARGGVAVAASLGANRLIFGSESGDCGLISEAAQIKSMPEFGRISQEIEQSDRRLGSAEVFDRAMSSLGISSPLGANDKLGCEYIRFGTAAGIESFTPVRRIGGVSASSVRERLYAGNSIDEIECIPDPARAVFSRASLCTEEKYNEILFYFCRVFAGESDDDIIRYSSRVAHDSRSASEFIAALPTKKYTLARIRRTILSHIIGCQKSAEVPDHTLILGASEVGRRHLAKIRKNVKIELITKPADGKSAGFESERRADELYCLCAGLSGGEMMRRAPFMT